MPKGFCAGGFIPFMQNNFDEDTRFILMEGAESASDEFTEKDSFTRSGVITIQCMRQLYTEKECREWLRECDAIILNWVDAYMILSLMPFFSKIALLFWGADLQNAKRLIVRGGIKGAIERKLIERARCLITLLPGEYTELCAVCEPRGRWFLGKLLADSVHELHLQPSLSDQVSGKRFLVGNSATQTNRHMEVFEQLARFIDRDITVYVPLAYGDAEYRQRVLAEGERLLGDSFHPLLDFVDYSKYADFLGTISVAIFNNNRQQGMGNITTLLAQGAKVFLSEDGPMFKDFSQSGYHVCKAEDICHLSYEDVVAFPDEYRKSNIEAGDFGRRHDQAVELWRSIIGYLKTLRKA